MTFKHTAALCLAFVCLAAAAQNRLKPFATYRCNVPEPSDIAYSPDYSLMYIVSDKGVLYKTDTTGKRLAAADVKGLDFEGLAAYNNLLYVTDERARRVLAYNCDSLRLVRQNEVAYNGAMNQGYEAIAYNETKRCFVVVTEKEPVWLFELNSDLVKINEQKLKIASDISGLSYHQGFLYALSDEEQMVIRLDPSSYKVLEKWKIPVTNPEGMTFDKAGHLVILSDTEQKIFKFKIQ